MSGPAPAFDDSPLQRVRPGAAAAWCLYDLANTVYAATLTFLFTPWFADRFGERSSLGITQTSSMILAGCMVPVLGVLADRTGRSRGYLTVWTLACIGAMAAWTFLDGRFAILACLFAANIGYQTALLFYNTLLPSVAPGHKAGLISGIGVGVGYLGTIVVLALFLILYPTEDPVERQGRFVWAAALFLVMALPCMIWVSDRRRIQTREGTGSVVLQSMSSLLATVRELPRHKSLMFFLLGNFFLVDVLNTAILFFADFTGTVFEEALAKGELSLLGHEYTSMESFVGTLGLGLNSLALAFGILLGMVTDRYPLRVMRAAGLFLGAGLVGGAVFGGVSTLGYVFTMVLCGALGLSGIWTAGRKIVVLLAPPDRIGEYFGLYGITVKISVIGSAVFGLVADNVDMKAAILAQGVQLALGLFFLYRVRLEAPR